MKSEDKELAQCSTCESTKTRMSDFRDKLSRREYAISGMCQECQDDYFEEDCEDLEEDDWTELSFVDANDLN